MSWSVCLFKTDIVSNCARCAVNVCRGKVQKQEKDSCKSSSLYSNHRCVLGLWGTSVSLLLVLWLLPNLCPASCLSGGSLISFFPWYLSSFPVSGERSERTGLEALRGGGAHQSRRGGSAPPRGRPRDRWAFPKTGAHADLQSGQRSVCTHKPKNIRRLSSREDEPRVLVCSVTEVYVEATESIVLSPSPTPELTSTDPPIINITLTDPPITETSPKSWPNRSSASQSSRSSTTQSEISSSDMSIQVREEVWE